MRVIARIAQSLSSIRARFQRLKYARNRLYNAIACRLCQHVIAGFSRLPSKKNERRARQSADVGTSRLRIQPDTPMQKKRVCLARRWCRDQALYLIYRVRGPFHSVVRFIRATIRYDDRSRVPDTSATSAAWRNARMHRMYRVEFLRSAVGVSRVSRKRNTPSSLVSITRGDNTAGIRNNASKLFTVLRRRSFSAARRRLSKHVFRSD